MKILITGICGFCGRKLAKYLQKQDDIDLYGLDVKGNSKDEIRSSLEKGDFFACDICDRPLLSSIIKEIKPSKIFHMAALSFDPESMKYPERFYMVNVFGTINLFEAVKAAGIDPLIHVTCSSAEYGFVGSNENPIKESHVFRPISPYGISKGAQDMVSFQYFFNDKLKIIRTRAFNVTGPGEREEFVCSNFAKQIANIEKNKAEPIIRVGNLEARRDFLDVRDVVNGYWLATEKGKVGEVYNICSGRAWSIQEVLNILLNLTEVTIKIEQDPKRKRPSDIPVQVGDYLKFYQKTGWKPTITLEQTLEDLLNYWRKEVL